MDRFPNYHVLSKRDSLSWNDATRRAIDARLAVQDRPEFLSADEYRTLKAVCERILPQPDRSEPDKVPIAGLLDQHLKQRGESGTRYEPMPYDGESWKIGLAALEAEAQARHGVRFHALSPAEADGLLEDCQAGYLQHQAWRNVPPQMFFKRRILTDIPGMYYAHPLAWDEMGFGGPASPRGYVRLQANRRDAWEAAEAYPGGEAKAARANERIR
jgi:hypothetical protein